MIIDTSVIVAILRAEPEYVELAKAIDRAEIVRLSAANLVEAAIVTDRWRSSPAERGLDDFLSGVVARIEPVTHEQALVARAAYHRFGKGSGHPARLNYGDCFAYALAKVMGEPLLFKGHDFVHTDIEPAS